MKSIKTFLALVLAASFASASFAASETTPPLIKVPKNEAAMEATRATIAKDAANNPVKPAAHKAVKPAAHKAAKSATHKPKAKQGKAAPAKKHKAKAPAAKK
ncbi:MAG: hypothetical protein H6R17_2854 [Proteobacteria bacterium]|nr:hypothetical protein [Pseudomonadota bacterium]